MISGSFFETKNISTFEQGTLGFINKSILPHFEHVSTRPMIKQDLLEGRHRHLIVVSCDLRRSTGDWSLCILSS